MILLLAGCGSFGLTPGGAPSDGEEPGLVIDGVDPSWGSPDEDTEVTITGTGLSGATTVYFGRSDVTVTRIDDETLVATAPAAGIEAVVDVRVVGEDGEDTLEDGFTYSETEPEESDADTDADSDADSDADTDADVDNSGKTGGVVEMSLVQYTCPQCFDPPLSTVEAYAGAAFHDAERTGWLDWLPAEGDCATNVSASAPASSFIDAGRWVYLTSGSRSLGLQSDSTNAFASDGLTEADIIRNAGYDLSLAPGGPDLDAFDIADVVTTPQAISSLTPTDLLLTSERDLFTARIARTGASFTWSPSGGGGSFVIDVWVFNASTGASLGQVLCRGPDNGRMTLPNSALSGYPAGSLVLVGMYRYSIDSFERPDDNSTVDTIAKIGVMGTGSLSP